MRPSEQLARGIARPQGRTRVIVVGTVLSLSALGISIAAPASAAVLGRAGAPAVPQLTTFEARQFGRWWEGRTLGESLALIDLPLAELRLASEQAWALGVARHDLRAALFTDASRTLFSRNAAGGEEQPSPYVEYFTNNPAQLEGLGAFFSQNPEYLPGRGGTQEQLFTRFVGLRESYLASLGLMEMDGLIVDPRNPRLTPYLVELFLGRPEPLPQPPIALNVART